ncbi:hypothetical protein ACFP56_20885 [Paenibacillus septentrionalis]|uniref:DUF2140 family protein n=1 Tax=Paenibacillus septentrionalis TaxID=429342 RepID=A0ABW1VC77_9BACL
MNKTNNKGKVYVVGVVIFTVLFIVGILELPYGTIQKVIFKFKVKNYLEQTYNEKMVVNKVTYLWDNIEPIHARVHPKNAEHLEFAVYPLINSANAYYDNYPETLWLHQVREDLELLLEHTDRDIKPEFSIDFACCMERDRVRVSNGEIIAYSEANLKFDLSFQLNHSKPTDDLEQAVHIITRLKQHEALNIEHVSFMLQPEPGDLTSNIEYKVPGRDLHNINSIEELEAYKQK